MPGIGRGAPEFSCCACRRRVPAASGLVRIVDVEHRFRELRARCERLAGVEGTDSDNGQANISRFERWERVASQLHGALPAEHSPEVSQELDDDALVALPRRRELDRAPVRDR